LKEPFRQLEYCIIRLDRRLSGPLALFLLRGTLFCGY
jgi:hypothetical protein